MKRVQSFLEFLLRARIERVEEGGGGVGESVLENDEGTGAGGN